MNLWEQEGWKIIPTNGIVNSKGEAVMGAGLALQARKKYPDLPKMLGRDLMFYGNIPFLYGFCGIITFPTKDDWRDKADLSLIEMSAFCLKGIVERYENWKYKDIPKFNIPIVGCGLGGLKWEQVKPILDLHLKEYEDRGIVVYMVED